MPVSVTMPRLGESVTEGTVTRWLKQEGEHVDADEPLLEVSTDKVDTEIPSPAAGTLLSIKVHEDETVEIGVELAVIGDAGEAIARRGGGPGRAAAGSGAGRPRAGAGRAPAAPQPPAPQPAAPAPHPLQRAPAQAPHGAPGRSAPLRRRHPLRLRRPPPLRRPLLPWRPRGRWLSRRRSEEVAGAYVTPLVRKLASEHGVDLATLQGTGVGGRIRKSDVLAAAQAAPAPQAPGSGARAPNARRGPAHAAPARPHPLRTLGPGGRPACAAGPSRCRGCAR